VHFQQLSGIPAKERRVDLFLNGRYI